MPFPQGSTITKSSYRCDRCQTSYEGQWVTIPQRDNPIAGAIAKEIASKNAFAVPDKCPNCGATIDPATVKVVEDEQS